MPGKVYNFPKPIVEDAEPIVDIPKPVYGVVRAVPKDMRL
jgi:hypothetical protein